MTAQQTLRRLREYFVGPSRFMTLQTCFELGIIEALSAGAKSRDQLAHNAGVSPAVLEQLLLLPVKEGFLSRNADGTYVLGGLASLSGTEMTAVAEELAMIKAVTLRQLYHLPESALSQSPVGLEQVHGVKGNLYEALGDLPELARPWGRLMDAVTDRVDPWFFDNVAIPDGARVLDLAGNTGLGAVNTLRYSRAKDLTVTTFDLPDKRSACLETFRSNGVEDRCDFIGGDAFERVPEGFDVILIKHFLPMFDRAEVFNLLARVLAATQKHTSIHILAPVVPEDLSDADNYTVDFYPSFFIGCSMGRGGPQQLSTWMTWLDECGFAVQDVAVESSTTLPPQALTAEAVLSAIRK